MCVRHGAPGLLAAFAAWQLRPRSFARCQGPRIEFCGRPVGGHTPIFYEQPAGNTASVNAGDYQLRPVGFMKSR